MRNFDHRISDDDRPQGVTSRNFQSELLNTLVLFVQFRNLSKPGPRNMMSALVCGLDVERTEGASIDVRLVIKGI